MHPTHLRTIEWAAHPEAAPRQAIAEEKYVSSANGTPFCAGGWQFEYSQLVPGTIYRVQCTATVQDLSNPNDTVVCLLYWGNVEINDFRLNTKMQWEYVCGMPDGAGRIVFQGSFIAPPEAETATVRTVFRWTEKGSVTWEAPVLEAVGHASAVKSVRVAVATGTEDAARSTKTTMEDEINFYKHLCQQACDEQGCQLIALPEICIQWHPPGHPFDKAVPVPGSETDRFSEIAQRNKTVVVVGLLERKNSAVYNSAVVIDTDGSIAGVYHKVHLASFEALSGVMPGDDFPVFQTEAGRIGCNICMDSSAAESSRMVGLNGGQFLVLPIMGDHRASRWTRGAPQLDEDRWQCIMRTRAMDNQLTMVVARNCARGSCIIDRSGSILAYNDGTSSVVCADVPATDLYRKWNGGCFRQVNWRQRRPDVYAVAAEPYPPALQYLRNDYPNRQT